MVLQVTRSRRHVVESDEEEEDIVGQIRRSNLDRAVDLSNDIITVTEEDEAANDEKEEERIRRKDVNPEKHLKPTGGSRKRTRQERDIVVGKAASAKKVTLRLY